MTPLPVPSLLDRLRAHAHLHPESAELLRDAAPERTDPAPFGKKGALALVAPDGTLVDVIDMPDATGAAR